MPLNNHNYFFFYKNTVCDFPIINKMVGTRNDLLL